MKFSDKVLKPELLLKRGRELCEQGQQTEAIEYYRLAAIKGNAEAQYELGGEYDTYGVILARDYKEALKWYKKAAKQNHAEALNRLGELYQYCDEIDKDPTLAFSYYEKSIFCHPYSLRGMVNIGLCYENNFGTQLDLSKAFYYYQKAAEDENFSDAQYHLGRCYENGIGTAKNPEKAFYHYQLAGEDGFCAQAAFALGNCYKNGIGTNQNYSKAIEYYHIASSWGIIEADWKIEDIISNTTNTFLEQIDLERQKPNDPDEFIFKAEKYYNDLKNIAKTEIKSLENYIENIEKSCQSFLELISSNHTVRTNETYSDFVSKLSRSDWEQIKQYLIEGELLFDFLCRIENQRVKKVDYSPALIEMTKALEYLLNLVFDKSKNKTDEKGKLLINLQDDNSYFKGEKIKQSIEFGQCAYLFERNRFKRLLNEIFDENKLNMIWNNLSSIKFPYYNKQTEKVEDFSFIRSNKRKTDLLFHALICIKKPS